MGGEGVGRGGVGGETGDWGKGGGGFSPGPPDGE